MGSYLLCIPWVQSYAEKTDHEYLITSFAGLSLLTILHVSLRFSPYQKVRQTILLCHLVMKVLMMLFFVVFAFQFTYGLWLDICIMQLWNTNVNVRLHSYEQLSIWTLFVYWFSGMLISNVILRLTYASLDALRPGLIVLPSLQKNENTPQDIIKNLITTQISLYVCITMVIACVLISISFLTVFLPFKTIGHLFKCSEMQFGEALNTDDATYLIILILVNLALYFHIYEKERLIKLFKNTNMQWIRLNSRIFGLETYLLGDENPNIVTNHIKPTNFKTRVI